MKDKRDEVRQDGSGKIAFGWEEGRITTRKKTKERTLRSDYTRLGGKGKK